MNLLTIINGVKTFVRNIDFLDISNSAFRIRLTGTSTANRVVNLPDDSVTLLGDDRPIGTLNAGVSLRGYEPIVTVTATKTLALSDSGTVQNCTNAAAAIITIPLNATVAFPIGAKVIVRRTTAQTVTIDWSVGVTVLNSLGATLTVTGVTSATVLRKTGTDSWIASPDLPESAIGAALRTAVDAPSAKSTIGLSAVTNVPLAEPRATVIRIGTGAGLSNNTTGTDWTAIGSDSGRNNTIGTFWTAIGSNAALASTTGAEWIAIGTYAGAGNTTGGAWAAIGNAAGAANVNGDSWIAVGNRAGRSNTGGSNWTAIGALAAFSSTTSSDWTAIGANAATNNTTGASWTAIGANAALASTTGTQWIAIGAYAGAGNTTGNFWTAIGNIAGAANVSGSNWVGIGHNAARFSTGSDWVMIGPNAGFDVTTGASNTMIGTNTGRGITTGGGNTIVGANVTGLAAALTNNVILASGDGVIKLQIDATGLATLPISPIFSDNSTLVATTAHVKNVLSNSPSITLTVLRWISGLFLGSLNWTPTANRTITLPDDSVTLLGDDRPIGTLNSGVSLRGYEPIVAVTATKTLALSDSGTVQICTNSAAAIATIPLNSAVAFPIGTRITIRKSTTFSVTLALTAGVSVVSELGSALVLTDIANDVIIRKTGTDTWSCRHSIPLSANLPGDPTCATQSSGSNNGRVSSTAFVRQELTSSLANIEQSKVRYLFVLAGESNSGGMALNSTLTSDQLLAQNHLKIWNNTTSTFQPLQIGTNNLISHTGLTDNIQHGIERGIAREVLEVLQYPEAYMVKAGQGSSKIADWSVGNATNYLSILTTRYNAARTVLVNAGFTVRPVLVWFQGINDAIGGTATATWRTATQAHFTQIRSLMGASTPIFMPLIMPTNASYIAINTEINTIDSADTNMWALPTSNITENPANTGHYTANGYLRIARAFVDSFRNSLGVPGSFTQGNARHVSSNPVVVLKRSAVFSIASNVTTVIPLDTIEIDTDNLGNVSNGSIVISPGSEGIYSTTGMCTTDVVQSLKVQIIVNSVVRAQSPLQILTANGLYSNELTRLMRLNAGDVITLGVLQSNSTNINVNTYTQAEFMSTLSLYRIGR